MLTFEMDTVLETYLDGNFVLELMGCHCIQQNIAHIDGLRNQVDNYRSLDHQNPNSIPDRT